MEKIKLTKQQRFAQSKKQALVLCRKLSDISDRQERFINRWLEDEKTKQYQANRVSNDKRNWKIFSKLDAAEDKAYKDYYNHIHKEFKKEIEKSPIHYTDRKYKNGFVDRQYVMDLYDQKAKKLGFTTHNTTKKSFNGGTL